MLPIIIASKAFLEGVLLAVSIYTSTKPGCKKG